MISGTEMVQTIELLDALIRKTIDDIGIPDETRAKADPSKPCPSGVIPALLWVLNRHEAEMLSRGFYKKADGGMER